MDIIRKDNGKNGVFLAVEDGIQLGEMTYIWDSENTIVIDHTGVPPQYEGQGIGRSLFMKAVEFAREKNIKIEPVCPFVVTLAQRIPNVKDVFDI